MNTLVLRNLLILLIAISAVATAGCSKITMFKSPQLPPSAEPLKVYASDSMAGRFNARMIFLADQLERNADRSKLGSTVIITSFSNLNKIAETSSFGRLVGENLMHELQVRKWQVYEIRLSSSLAIDDTGEFILSRDVSALKEQYKVGGIVTGTYTATEGDIIVNARLIDMNTGLLISSAQTHFPKNWFTDTLLGNDDGIKPMKIISK